MLELVGESPDLKALVEGWPDTFVQVVGHLCDQVMAVVSFVSVVEDLDYLALVGIA